MQTRHLAAAVVLAAQCTTIAITAQAQTMTVPLWPNGAPGSEAWTQKETVYGEAGNGHVRNVVTPSLTIYLPDAAIATGTAVIIAPGGGFRWLAWEKEGTLVAEWLQRRGVAGLVLKYRLSDTGTDAEFQQTTATAAAAARGRGAAAAPPASATPAAPRGNTVSATSQNTMSAIQAMAAADGRQALKVAREHAAEWRLDPAKIGIMGFSAGGYVAVMAALEPDTAPKPAFTAAIYTCCVRTPIPTLPDDAGPLFIASAANDPISVTAGPALFTAWTAVKKSAEIHIYSQGGHGFGMSTQNLPSDAWIDRFGDWLRTQRLMK